jgi:SAM-dependent methyltransferase
MAVEWSGDLARLVEQLAAIQPRIDLDEDALLELFWEFHPRFRFVKSLPWAANLLDLGAGAGGLAHWRGWGKPARPDLNLFGIDLNEGEHRALYAGWETIDLDRKLPDFPAVRLNAFLATHLIEHLADPEQLVRWIAERGEPGSRIYLEWPNPETLNLPTREELARHGIEIVVSNFHDDSTHRACPEVPTVLDWLGRGGLDIVAHGAIDLGAIGEEIYARAGEPNLRTIGYWSLTRWCVFVEAVKPAVSRGPGWHESGAKTAAHSVGFPVPRRRVGPAAARILDAIARYPDLIPEPPASFRHGRSVRDGYVRGVGLEYEGLDEKIEADPDYQHALGFALDRGLVTRHRLMNLFLLIKFYLPKIGFGHIVEFGSYRAGAAFFMASLAQRFLPGAQVYALDSFAGMPDADATIDAHGAGDFDDVQYDEICAARDRLGLSNLHLVRGLFAEIAPKVLRQAGTVALAHIDCDIRESVAYAYDSCKPHMVEHGYIVFDDSTTSSCIGATEAVETLVVARDGLRSEQIYPHHVFRIP